MSAVRACSVSEGGVPRPSLTLRALTAERDQGESMRAAEEGTLDRDRLTALQGERLRGLLAEILPANRFYAAKFAAAGLSPASVHEAADLHRLPFTTKAELLADQAEHPPYGTNLTYPRERYTRLHQTSGTQGQPLRWLDTTDSWQWMLDCWKQ